MEITQIQSSENRSQALTWKYQHWRSIEKSSFELDFGDDFSRLFEFPVWWARKTEVIEVAKFRFYAPRSEEKPQFVNLSDFMLRYSGYTTKLRSEKDTG